MPHPKGGYRIDGKRVPGTTTPIGRFKDSGALLWWAFEQGKAAERGEISSLYDKRDESADAGTDYDIEIYNMALQGYENYLNWAENNRIVIMVQEIPLVSEKYRFGGCPDAIGHDSQNRLCLLDWKTSNGVYPDYLIQLAAYGQLWDENNPDNPITGGFHLCRFSKEHADFAHHYWAELDDAWEQFKLFLKAYQLDKRLKKRV
jgi:hypothetical protein